MCTCIAATVFEIDELQKLLNAGIEQSKGLEINEKSKIHQLPSLQSKVESLEKSTLFSRTWDELTKETATIVLKEIRDETKRDRKDHNKH